MEKQKEYKIMIEKIVDIGDQFQQELKKRRDCMEVLEESSQNGRKDKDGYLSKSHPRLSNKSKNIKILTPIII